MLDYDGECVWNYDGNRQQTSDAKGPDGIDEESKMSNPDYKKESEKTKVNKYKKEDFP